MSQYPEINRYDDHSNKLKNENQTIISEDAGNSDKFQQWFMIKPLNKLGIEKTYLNIIKVETKPQPTSYQKWKAESISSEIGNKTSTTTLATFIQHSIGSSSHSNQRRKEIKCIQIEKGEVKLSPFAGMIPYRENIKKPPKSIRINVTSLVA